MSLITPDFGLLFWMVLIFGIVFFVLAKFGFPVITSMVQKRSDHIAESLRKAQEAQDKLEGLAAEQTKMIEQTRLEQKRILKEASQARDISPLPFSSVPCRKYAGRCPWSQCRWLRKSSGKTLM